MSVNRDARRLSRRHALRSLQSGVLSGALLGIAPMRVLADDDQTLAVVGSWLIRSRPANKPLPVTSLITYTAQAPAFRRPSAIRCGARRWGCGRSWENANFAVTFEASAFDPNGHFANVSQVRVQSVLDEALDSYKGRFEVYTLDDDGTPIRMDSSGLVAATRIQLARLEAQA